MKHEKRGRAVVASTKPGVAPACPKEAAPHRGPRREHDNIRIERAIAETGSGAGCGFQIVTP
jgi:hypothetical protein